MKFDEIMKKLNKDEAVVIAGGEVIINRKLQCMIGGIPIYDIIILYTKENKELTVIKSLDELYDLSLIYGSEGDIRRCIMCDELPEQGYYEDRELKQYYCCFDCLVKWMNNTYGQGAWKIDCSDFGRQKFLIQIEEDEVKDFRDAVKIEETWWRPYDMEYVPPYDFCADTFTIEESNGVAIVKPIED